MPQKKTAGTINEEVARAVRRRGPTPGTRPDRSEAQVPQLEPDEVSQIVSEAMEIASWPPVDTDDAQQVEERIRKYYAFCAQTGMRPSIVGIALAFGVSRMMLWKWENGVESNKPEAVRNVLKKARVFNEMLLEQYMQTGRINPVSGIFLLKNHAGYKDQQDVVITPNSPLDTNSPGQVRDQYMQALPEASETDDTDTK